MTHVLVVGAAGGIGGALLRALVDRGDAVTATLHTAGDVASITEEAPGAAVHAVDLSHCDEALAALQTIVGGLPRLDVVAFCAGVAPFGPTEHTPLQVFRQVMEINAFAPVAVFQATVASLRESRGRFLIVSSLCGRLALPILPAYSASKFAVEAIADVMRREVVADGVAIVVVEPGGVSTAMVEHQVATARACRDALPPAGADRYGSLYDSYQELVTGVSNNPPSTPEQVAAAMIEVIDAAHPLEPRYIVGEDAIQAIEALKGMSDRDADLMVGQMFPR